jgi:hypothetical protein
MLVAGRHPNLPDAKLTEALAALDVANLRLPITQQIVRKLAVEIASNVSYLLMLSFIGQRRNEPARSGGSSR